MKANNSSVAAIEAPWILLNDQSDEQGGWLIDVRVKKRDTEVKLATESGQIRMISLVAMATPKTPAQHLSAKERKELEHALRQVDDTDRLMRQATDSAREKAATLGWLVGITTVGFPVQVPGCPGISHKSEQPDGRIWSIGTAIDALPNLISSETSRSLDERSYVSAKTLYRKRQTYSSQGIKALVHGSQGTGRLEQHPDAPAIREFAFQMAERQATDVRISKTNFVISVVAAAKREQVVQVPPTAPERAESVPYRLLRKYAREAHAHWRLGSPRSRRESRAVSSRSSAPALHQEPVPFASIQIDATQHDAHCLDELGRKCEYVEKLSAYCNASGAFIDCMFIAGHATARDVVDFILQLMIRSTNDMSRHLLTPGRLRTVCVSLTQTDRGSNMIAIEATRLLADIGIEVVVAAPSRGDQKGRVESGQRRQNQRAQLTSGYFGSTQREAPAFDYRKQYLPIAVAERYEKSVGLHVYNHTPKATLRVPGFKVALSPQMYIDAYEQILPLPDKPFPSSLIKQALEKHSGVLTANALQYKGEQYVLAEGMPKPILSSDSRTASGHRVTFYPVGRRPEFLIVETHGRAGEIIDLVLLRRDVMRREFGADVTAIVNQGLEIEHMERESKAEKARAEDNLYALIDEAHTQSSTPVRVGSPKSRAPEPSGHSTEVQELDSETYLPSKLMTTEDWLVEAEAFVASRELNVR